MNLISKDVFVKGLHSDMQLALKSVGNFASLDYSGLTEQTCRLELAGVTSIRGNKVKIDINAIDKTPKTDANEEFIYEVSNRVLKSLNQTQPGDRYTRGQHTSFTNYSNDYHNRRGGKTDGKRLLTCRNCQSTQHLAFS